MPRKLLIKVTAGADDPERCNQAFTVAATAAASGAPVSLWLTGEAAWFAVPRKLLIKVTAGADDPERCNQAFTVAATAVASGAPVSLWLTGEAAWFAVPGKAEDFSLPKAAPLADLLAAVVAGGSVTLCTQCAARRDIAESDVLPGVVIAGAPSFVDEALGEGVQALVY